MGVEGRILYLLPAGETLPYVRRRIAESPEFAARVCRTFGIRQDDLLAWLDKLPPIHNCPGASAGCIKACLVRSGNALQYQGVNDGRAIRTLRFAHDRDAFMRTIVRNIESLVRKAERDGSRPAVRLNGTSDIPWHTIPVVRNKQTFAHVFDAFPEVTFYDYTKVPGGGRPLSNHYVTFSLSEDNDRIAYRRLLSGRNVAVVFDVKANKPLPKTFHGFPVIDGDRHDWRFLDPQGVIVGLRAKALAKTDATGFVRATSSTFDLDRKPTYPALTYNAAD
jgi:hypothetical protein